MTVKAELLEGYVTGAVLDALESPRAQQALADGADQNAPRRRELLADIERAQETRAQARRDLAEDIIDRADWLDIRQRTEERISGKRREYDRLTATGPVLGDIPRPSECGMCGSYGTSSAAGWPSAVPHRVFIKILPRGVANNPGSRTKDAAKRRELEMAVLRQRVDFDWRI